MFSKLDYIYNGTFKRIVSMSLNKNSLLGSGVDVYLIFIILLQNRV